MKAFEVTKSTAVYVYNTPVNMHFSFDSLARLTKALPGEVFLFCNKKKNYVKVFYYYKGGWCIFAKRLEHGQFDTVGSETLTWNELHSLLHSVVGKKKLLKAA